MIHTPVIGAALLVAAPAMACPPPPPPPEQAPGATIEAYRNRLAAIKAEERRVVDGLMLERQRRHWQEAALVMLVRVERPQPRVASSAASESR